MIICVVEKQRIHHLLDRDLTPWTGRMFAIGELELALPAYDLMLFFGGHHQVAFATTDETSEGEFKIRFGTRSAITAQQGLHLIIFSFTV